MPKCEKEVWGECGMCGYRVRMSAEALRSGDYLVCPQCGELLIFDSDYDDEAIE